MKTVLVSGVLADKYRNGGHTWVRFSWVAGLRRLGFDVYFIDQTDPAACVDEVGDVARLSDSINLRWFNAAVEWFGMAGRAALLCGAAERCEGMPWSQLRDVAAQAELLVNFSGHLTLSLPFRNIRRKVYVDEDPGFTQFWHAAGDRGARLEGHNFYFTVGENIGTPACIIPTGRIPWRPIRAPVVLADWPVSGEGQPDRFTTVASWRGPLGPVEYAGRTFGLKVHQFRKYLDLPRRVPKRFEIALDIHPADEKDRLSLLNHGWQLVDPREIAGDAAAFRRYVQGSGAEFSVAQGIYVDTNSGWFSDRTVRYLASGKPALVQDTGFGRTLPVGEGLIPFGTLEEAVVGAERIAGDYERHCRAARAIAEEYFDSDKVLGRFLEEVGVAP